MPLQTILPLTTATRHATPLLSSGPSARAMHPSLTCTTERCCDSQAGAPGAPGRQGPHAGWPAGAGSVHLSAGRKGSAAHGLGDAGRAGWRPARRRAPLRRGGLRVGAGGRAARCRRACGRLGPTPRRRRSPALVAHLGSQEPGCSSEKSHGGTNSGTWREGSAGSENLQLEPQRPPL